MTLLNFRRRGAPPAPRHPSISALLEGFSIEAMPRSAEAVEDFRALLPAGTRVCLAHIAGTPIEAMVATAARLAREGCRVMPHFPARLIDSRRTLEDWIDRYQGEAGVDQALVLAGGVAAPCGAFDNAMQLLESGSFDRAGFRRLHVAGHPEGNRDIDPDGGTRNVAAALRWKHAFSQRTDARMAVVTQFVFDAAPVIRWTEDLAREGVDLPVHVGLAGPAKLQTLIRFGVACGVGPSLKVLQKRALDVSRLVLPYTPDEVVAQLAAYRAAHPACLIEGVHFFPLGGIKASARWATEAGGAPARPACAP